MVRFLTLKSSNLTNIMLKTQVLKIVGETSNKIDANMTRLEKFEVSIDLNKQ